MRDIVLKSFCRVFCILLQKAICIACIYINVEMKYDTVQKDSLIENKETVRIIELGKDKKRCHKNCATCDGYN